MKISVLVCAVMLGIAGAPALADIAVWVSPPEQLYDAGAGATSVDLVADIPEADAVIGFGLDFLVEALLGPGGLMIDGVTIGSSFDPLIAPDGDLLAGLVAPPEPVWGSEVLLATVDVSWDDAGVWELTPGVTPGDAAEGFPTSTGYAAVSSYTSGLIAAPEPGTAFLVLSVLMLSRRR